MPRSIWDIKKLSLKTVMLSSFVHIAACADSGSSIYLPGEKIKEGELPGGYNESASYRCKESWKVLLTADYIFWRWQQSGMQLGTLMSPTTDGSSAFLNGTAEVVLQIPSYTSGFQIGLGCNLRGMDDWNVYANYTWYENTDTMTTQASSGEIFAIAPSVFQYVKGATSGVLLSDDLWSKARLKFDSVDLVLQRPFYFGKKLTANISMGLQALWISQEFSAVGNDLTFVAQDAVLGIEIDGSFDSSLVQKSWGLGPKVELNANWLLGYGVKIVGAASFSALFTSYHNLQTSLTGALSDINVANLSYVQPKNYNTVNPIAETFIGLGWGSYLDNNKLHFGIMAGYDFKVYWNQDVFDTMINDSGSPSDMTLRGLNIQVRFDF